MNILPHFLRSLFLAVILSFAAPALLVAGLLISLLGMHHIPGCTAFSQSGVEQVLTFLAAFGEGNSLHGLVTIGLTFSLVGGLFDAYAFYRYQTLRGG